jgi:predicted dehydrogenase
MPPSQTRIATIGTWGHCVHVLAELATVPQACLAAHARSLPEDQPDHIRQITKKELAPWYDDYHQMLREVRPDVVIISTRIDRINPIAIDAAEAGCHLICEKPLAITLESLRQLYAACTANKRQCIAMLGNGQNPAVLAASQLIQSGQLGEVVLANARKSYKWGTRPEWFGDRKLYGDTIGWIGIHSLDTIHALTGQDFISVAAMESNLVHHERPDCQDNGVLILGLSGGGHASVSFDYLRPAAASTHGDSWVRIVGSRGVVEASLDHGWCRFVSSDSAEREMPLPAAGSYYRAFLEGISGGVYPPAEMRRAFMLTRVCLCARMAAEKKSVEQIPLDAWGI